MTGQRAIIGIAGLALIVVAGVWALPATDSIKKAEAAAKAGRWSEVVTQSKNRLRRNPEDWKAKRLLALGQAKLGLSHDSVTNYFALGVERMTPEDFIAVSDVLRKDGRQALAWLALEAASRIDPKDAAVRIAMTDLRSQVGRKGTIAHVVDHLSSIPTGPALGELVVDLSQLVTFITQIDGSLPADDPIFDPIFDRVMARDRATLRTLNSPIAVRRLIARAEMETGWSGTAYLLLQNDYGSPEAAWLRSRISLQAGEIKDASKHLEEAGSFAADRIHEPEPALYVGAKACRTCHRKEYDAQQSSRHATTLYHGPGMLDVKLPDTPLPDPVDPKIVHTFTREGEKIRVETKVGDTTYQALMDFALGSGHRGLTMIGKDSTGVHRELRMSQYSEKGFQYDVTSGFSPHPSDPSEYLGKALSPAGFRECIHCHATRFRSITDRSGPEAADRGIGCERCHGPGGNHVKAMNSGFGDLAIGRFKEATGPQRMTACSGCHASDGTFPPNDPQYIRFQSTTLPFSKCYVESKGKLDCVTCHNPHEKLETSARFYENKCLDCHGSTTAKKNDEFRHVACPVNPKSDCLKCHMPTRQEAAPHTSFTDHHIRVHREEKPR